MKTTHKRSVTCSSMLTHCSTMPIAIIIAVGYCSVYFGWYCTDTIDVYTTDTDNILVCCQV